MQTETDCLRHQIEKWKAAGTLSQEQLVRELRKLADLALREENFYEAFLAYQELDDKEALGTLSQVCMQKKRFCDALEIFDYLSDKNGYLQLIREAGKVQDKFLVERSIQNYFGQERSLLFQDAFQQWISQKGFSKAVTFFQEKSVNMAYHLAHQYDIGVGIAKAGLCSTYVFNLFGLETKLAACHRRGRGATFEWCEEISAEDFEGKRVAVIENDVVSGRTSKRILRELQIYNPKTVDLILVHDPVSTAIGIGTIQANIPPGYGHTHFPQNFSYASFDKAVETLDIKLGRG